MRVCVRVCVCVCTCGLQGLQGFIRFNNNYCRFYIHTLLCHSLNLLTEYSFLHSIFRHDQRFP